MGVYVSYKSSRKLRQATKDALALSAAPQCRVSNGNCYSFEKAADPLFEESGKSHVNTTEPFTLFKSNFMALFKTKWSTK